MIDLIRRADRRTASEFLTRSLAQPCTLVVEGQAGIGKTTFWLSVREQARELGFRVLSARPAEAESVLAYASLADLLAGLDPSVFAGLPSRQRQAFDQVLLRSGVADTPTDPRAVAAGFVAVIDGLSEHAPVVIAIDDLQWLDPSTSRVVAFAIRRLSGRVGILVTVRTGDDSPDPPSWIWMPGTGPTARIQLGPLALGELHAVVSHHLGRSFSRPTMVRIHDVCGGNPFYAIELARTVTGDRPAEGLPLPATLAQLVRARIGRHDERVQKALLATACLAAPTVDAVAAAISMPPECLTELLEAVEDKGIIAVHGNRLTFGHPLLARGVYTESTPAQRRAMHRQLAEVVDQPELRARHLALATTNADPITLCALDDAAESARMRGAPAAAAKLLELAIGLGGDTPERRIRSARDYFDAGDPERSRTELEETIKRLAAGSLRAQALSLLAVVRLYDEGYSEAAALLERALDETGDRLELRVPVLVTLAWALFNAGRLDEAVVTVDDAVTGANRLGEPHLLSQALGMAVLMHFLHGEGVDQVTMRRAMELARDAPSCTPIPFRPRVQNALLLAFTNELEQARAEMAAIRRDALRDGEEGELSVVAFHGFMVEWWAGNLAEARQLADDIMELALQQADGPTLVSGLVVRAWLAAYAGRESEARQAAGKALRASRRSGTLRVAQWAVAVLGFLDVSVAKYEAALEGLQPLLRGLAAAPDATEVVSASFVPDAVEALVQLGRLAEAEPLVVAIERNGRRLDRAWMLAIGARCRGMLLAAQGDIVAGTRAVEQALVHHERLAMPFERARTLLLLGQLQRRQRKKDASARTIREALDVFEKLDTPLWADRARVELERTSIGRQRGAGLTPSEQRVAELAASGMTNRDVAAALFISSKTVEANLVRIYRKLGIRSRAELGQHIKDIVSDRKAVAASERGDDPPNSGSLARNRRSIG